MELTPLGGRSGNVVVEAAASRSPFGERRRRSSSAVLCRLRKDVSGFEVMKILLAIASLLLTACTRPRAPTVGTYDARPAAPTVAIRAVTVVDVMDGSLLPEQTVLIARSRIVAVGRADEVRIPRDAELVEAAGRYLIPGLWDMHVHSVGPVADDTPSPSIAAQDWHLPLFLAHGVTGVRNMNDGTGDVTLELTKTIKRQLAEGSRLGPPRFFSAGPAVDGDPPLGFTKKVVVRTAAEARAVVEQLASNGADLIKVYENVSREAYFAILGEARRRRIPVDGHLPFRITAEEAAEAGQRTVEHPDALAAGCSTKADAERKRFMGVLADYDARPGSESPLLMQLRHVRVLFDSRDPAACASAIQAFRRNGVALTADLLVYHHIVNAEEILSDTARLRHVPEAIRRNWEGLLDSETTRELQSILGPIPALELENVRLANEAGVMLLAATDVDIPMGVPGLSLHEELVRLVQAGLTPLAALQAATRNPARVLGLTDALGRIEPGKLADLVLLDANPLEDIRNTQKIRAVVADGQLYRRADLDRLLAKVEVLTGRKESARSGITMQRTAHGCVQGRCEAPPLNAVFGGRISDAARIVGE
jgi:imidazolonepropionase-like amidohydrolase